MRGVHVPVIVEIVRGMSTVSPVRYLELGVGNGQTFNRVAPLCDLAWAVDKSGNKLGNARDAGNVTRSAMSTDEFFAEWHGDAAPWFDVIFIDAWHEADQVWSDFLNSFRLLRDNGIILMHDGYPPNRGGMSKSRSWSAWEAITRVRDGSRAGAYECVTLPFGHGVTVVRKADRQLMWEGAPDA